MGAWKSPAGLAALALTAGIGTAALAEETRVVVVMDPPSAETNRFWTTSGDLHLGPALQTLVGNDPMTGEYDTSALATSWEASDDFTSWTFHLDPAAEFHDGWGPVTAADVVHSYELHTGEDSILSGLGLLAGAEVAALDDHTVRFDLPDARPNFLFAHGGRGIMVVYSLAQHEAEGLEGYDRAPAGSGPFRFVERRIGEGVTFERVEGHWSGQDAQIETLELRYVAEPSTKLAMLLAGEADIVALPRELQGEALDAGFEIVASTGPAMQTAFMLNNLYPEDDPGYNPDLPWLDIRIREAMNRAIDRDVMIDVLYDGRAEKLVRFMMHEPHEGFAQELVERFEDDYGYDPLRAKALLDEAGYPDSFAQPVIPIISTGLGGNPEFPAMAELLQVFFEDIGLQTEIVEMDWGSLGGSSRARQAHVLRPMRNAPIRPTELGIGIFYTSRGNPINFFEGEVMEGLIARLSATLDPDERDAIAREAFTYLSEHYADLPMASLAYEVVVDPARIAAWPFPGQSAIGLSHWHLIEPAR